MAIYKTDIIFNARANTFIPSAPILSALEGFGMASLSSIILIILLKKKNDILLPICWAVVGILVPYLPFAQQRKLIMGAHIPFCLLTAVLVSYLTRNLKSNIRNVVFAAVLLASIPSNIMFMNNDINLLSKNTTVTKFAPYLSDVDYNLMQKTAKLCNDDESIMAPPEIALFIPALFGKQVYCGHWSETPDYMKKLKDYASLIKPETTNQQKSEMIKRTNVDFIIVPPDITLPNAKVINKDNYASILVIEK